MITPDPYVSRQGRSDDEIVDRPDPVLWSGADAPGPWSRAQLEAWDRDGFLIVERVFEGDALARLRDAATHAAERTQTQIERGGSAERLVREPNTGAVRSVFAVHTDRGRFARLAAHPQLAGPARQILGTDVYVHQSRINYKPGFTGERFDWHSDFETWHVEDGMPRPRALSASVLLDDNTEFNGSLMLVAGSHRHYVRCAGTTPDEHFESSLRKQTIGVPSHDSIVALARDESGAGGRLRLATAPAGSVVFFDCNTLHGSGGNISPQPRSNVFIVFNSVDNALTQPLDGLEPRPRVLASREVVPVDALA